MTARVEIYQDEADEWRFRRIAANGETIAYGEGYARKTDATTMAKQLFPGLEVWEVDTDPEPEQAA